MSLKYSFNWYSWFKKPEEIEKQVDGKHFLDKHNTLDDYPWEIKVRDKDILRSLNKYASKTRKERKTSLRKSKTSLKVRRRIRHKHSHHTIQPKKDKYSNKNYKNEHGRYNQSKNYKHYKTSKFINESGEHEKRKHSGAGGDMATEKHHKREKYSDFRKSIKTKDIDQISRREKQSQNRDIPQMKSKNTPFKKEDREENKNRIKHSSLGNKNTNFRANIEHCLSREKSEEITQNVIDLTTSFQDDVKLSLDSVAGKNIPRTEEEHLRNFLPQKKLCSKSTRTFSKGRNSKHKSEKQNKPEMCLFSKVWPSDNSNEKIAKQNGHVPGNNNSSSVLYNKSRPHEKGTQNMKRRSRTTSTKNIDSKKKETVKNNHTLLLKDENGKNKTKQVIGSQSNSYKDNSIQKTNTYLPSSYRGVERDMATKGSDKSKRNNSRTRSNEKVASIHGGNSNVVDSINFISILKEIKSLKDQLKSLSDDEDLKENSQTIISKSLESKRTLECIEEEIDESTNTELKVPISCNLQNVVPLQTATCGKEPQLLSNNKTVENFVIDSAQNVTIDKSIVSHRNQDTILQDTPQSLAHSENNSHDQQANPETPCKTIKTDSSEIKNFSISESPAKCLYNELIEHDCNQFLNRRIFYFKSYIPASERKNKKEVLMKKRLLSRLRTCSIPIKRKLDASSSSNLRKMKCSSSSKEDIVYDRQMLEAPAYDFSPFLKRSIPCTSFFDQNSFGNPFFSGSEVSRCTSNSIVTGGKVCSYMCNSIDLDRRAKSESSLKYLKKPQSSTCKLQVFGSHATNEESNARVKQKSLKPLDRQKKNEKRSTKKNKQRAKNKTMKAKQKQMIVDETPKVDNVLKIENLSSHSNSVWKTISIEFNDTSLESENLLSEDRLQLMLSEITEYLKTKAVQLNNFNVKVVNNIDSSNVVITDGNNHNVDIDNVVEDLSIPQQTSEAVESEPEIKLDVCLDGFEIDDERNSPSEKSSQTSTNESLTNSNINIQNPYFEIMKQGREIQQLHENNEENKKQIEKIRDTCSIKFPWIEKVIYQILTEYQRFPTDFPTMSNFEQVCYLITNLTFRKSLSISKTCHFRHQQIENVKVFYASNNSNSNELIRKEKMIEYHTVESYDNSSIKLAKNIKKSKISHFTKHVRKIFRVFVMKKKH
ncbi:MATH and LRR domain-containing protein PFE0570w [Nilaparvata lugens]|uniref:MATH and LRR domain-containing protein PFE0570w n=1 Tax=Nilaparvata lugens TaxID=108931 RepID=UPI00193CAF95|nr:MATH and LRR domain-containing protein PFE0570w [Nilaparvata lugens]